MQYIPDYKLYPSHWDQNFYQRFTFTSVQDADGIISFSCEGHISNDLCVIEEIELDMWNGDDWIAITDINTLRHVFNTLGYKVLEKNMVEKYGCSFDEVKI